MYSFADLLPLAEEVFDESCSTCRSLDEALQDVIQLLLQYAGYKLSTETASLLLQSLHPTSSEDLGKLWETALGLDPRPDRLQASPMDSAPRQEEAPSVATSQNALEDRSPQHTILPTQQIAPVAGSIPQAKSLETTASSHAALVTEAHLACLLKAMAVFPDISRSYVLFLIRARFDHNLSVEDLSNIVISELLEAESYSKSDHGDPVEGKTSELLDEEPATIHRPSPHQSCTSSPTRFPISNASCGGLGDIHIDSPSYNPWGSRGDGQAAVTHLSHDLHSFPPQSKLPAPHGPSFAEVAAHLEQTLTSASQDPEREMSAVQSGLEQLSLQWSPASEDGSTVTSADRESDVSPATPVSPVQLPGSGLRMPREIPFVRSAHLLNDPFSSSSPRVRHTLLFTELEAASLAVGQPILDTPGVSEDGDSDYPHRARSHNPNVPRRRRELMAAQGKIPGEGLSERRTSGLSSSPADIEGKFEYVKPEEARNQQIEL